MPRPAFTWVLTDTHWFHDAICKPDFENRPVDHMDRVVRACKHLVKPQDLLIHLGDVIFYRHEVLKPTLDSFPCRKVLTMGNHDRKSRGWYLRNGFDFVCDAFILDDVCFQHIPSRDRRAPMTVHGHWHGGREIPDWWSPERYRLISLEIDGYAPQRLERVLARTVSPVPATMPSTEVALETGGPAL